MPNPELLCIGHRGAMGHAPENTLASVRKAVELGSPFIEVDVYSVDGHLVVFHDDHLERTTNGSGYLCQQSFEYLRTLDAGNGERIPTLREVCDAIVGRAGINIELKGPHTAQPVVELITELVQEGWNEDDFLVSSFNQRELVALRQLSDRIKLGALLCGLPVDDAKFAQDLGAFSVHPSLEFIDRHFIDDAHARNLQVYVYTVNHPEDITRMHELGADGVFTNFPERVLADYSQGDVRSWE
ncbi:MAG: glycerophosphodiester phosphodiesterase family protein [Cyanobacteria bacterium P01_E01_bin.45]